MPHAPRLRWLGMAIAPLLLASPALAQQSYPIRTPAPYNACNVRSGPSTANAVVGTYRNGVIATLLGERAGGWYRVEVGGTVGWVARQCLGL